jgi:1,4-alpha-glucan branching enzyme
MIRKQNLKGNGKVQVTFILPEDHPYGQVSVVGDFNNWDPAANRFVRRNNKTYSTAVKLIIGKRYAFRYFSEDGHWVNDEAADAYEPNEFGTDNCILTT